METIVFAGPSTYGLDLAPRYNFSIRPPAVAGDILAATREGVRRIGLIDGLYGDCAAVWHKEILYALSHGVAVFGAASMGALRAAECEAFGMTGIGEIFRSYRTGDRVSDADVAVSHAPRELGYQPVTIALVDAEATIQGLSASMEPADTASLMAAASALHFSKRTWRSIAGKAGFGIEMARTLAENARSVKRADALELLDTLRNDPPPGLSPVGWSFQNTIFFQNLANRLS